MRKILIGACSAGIAALAAVCGISAYVQSSSGAYLYAQLDSLPGVEAVLVPGAALAPGGGPSGVLRDRADAAVMIYRAGKAAKILVTGDDGSIYHDEVSAVRRYLVEAGIPSRDIFLDHAGFDTYSSMYRARDVFRVTSVTVVTQSFHLQRAVFTARALGLEAYGFAAKSERRYIYDFLREIPASVKALLDVRFGRVPKYLGEPYPIQGDGRETWYDSYGEATTTADFIETGVIVFDTPGLKKGVPYLIYEKPGAPALKAELIIGDESVCAAQGGEALCAAMSVDRAVAWQGRRARVEGTIEATSSVLVLRIEFQAP